MATKSKNSGQVTGTMNGQKVTFSDASAAKGYSNVTLDKSPDKKQLARSAKASAEAASLGPELSQDQIKEKFPEIQPGGLAYNGKVTNPVQPTPPNAQGINTGQPSPTTVNATPFTGQAPQGPADSATIQKAFQDTISSGLPAPQTQGAAAGQVQGALAQNAPAPAPQTPPEVENFLQTSPLMQTSMQELQEFLAPTETAKMMADSMKKIVKGQKEMASMKLELMDIDRVMAGTEQDLRDEVEAVNGFATESQVQALTIGRNKTLLQKATMIQNKLNYMQDVIESDMMMYGFQKDAAAQEFQQRSFLLNFKQENDRFIYQATQDAVNRNLQLMGPDGMYNATGGDPVKISRLESIMGLQPGGLLQAADMAFQKKEEARKQQEFENRIQQQQVNISGANLNLARDKFAWDQQMDLANLPMPGQVDEKTLGKIQASSEYKTIGALLPAVQTIKKYQDMVNKHGSFAKGEAGGELKSAYGNAIAAWKTLAGLGALSGADFELAENAIPGTGGWSSGFGLFKRNAPIEGKLKGSLENAVSQAENLTKRLTQLYPDASGLLNQQLDDILVRAYPDKYKQGPDGQVYEITN